MRAMSDTIDLFSPGPQTFNILLSLDAPGIVNKRISDETVDLSSGIEISVDKEWYDRILIYIENATRKLENGIKGSEVDKFLFRSFHTMKESDLTITVQEAFSHDLWNAVVLSSEVILKFISLRWGYPVLQGLPFTKGYADQLKSTQMRRYVIRNSSDLPARHTLARIWISSLLVPRELGDIFFKQQDFVDYTLHHTFVLMQETNGKLESPLLNIYLKVLDEYLKLKANGKVKFVQQDLHRNVYAWLTTANRVLNLSNYNYDQKESLIRELFEFAVM